MRAKLKGSRSFFIIIRGLAGQKIVDVTSLVAWNFNNCDDACDDAKWNNERFFFFFHANYEVHSIQIVFTLL